MSTFFDDEINCSCCGGKVKVTCIGSTNSFGGCDLDTRPAPMQRWTMGYWIQACPHCGYVNPDLEEHIPGVESIINSKEYKDTIALYSAKEFEKLMEKARSTGNNAIMRYLFGSTVEVGSFENLPDALSEYVAHFWNEHNPWPVLTLEDGVYLLRKGNFINCFFRD